MFAVSCKKQRRDRYRCTIIKLQVEGEDTEDSVQLPVNILDCII